MTSDGSPDGSHLAVGALLRLDRNMVNPAEDPNKMAAQFLISRRRRSRALSAEGGVQSTERRREEKYICSLDRRQKNGWFLRTINRWRFRYLNGMVFGVFDRPISRPLVVRRIRSQKPGSLTYTTETIPRAEMRPSPQVFVTTRVGGCSYPNTGSDGGRAV